MTTNRYGKHALVALMLAAAPASAGDAVATALSSLLGDYQRNVLEAAEKFKDSDYDFKPSHDVFTVRLQFAHIADVNYSWCSALKEEENPNTNPLMKRDLPKSDLIPAVRGSFEYCLGAFGASDDAAFAKTVKRGSMERTKAWIAMHVVEHVGLHYGNLITYMRVRGIVPPETERRTASQQR